MAAKSQGGWGRNWDEMMRNYSSGEDSDEHDIPNLVSFQKNVRRNAQLIQSFIPHMTPEGAQTIPPMLMQDPYVMHEDLLKSGFFESVRSSGSRAMAEDDAGKVEAVPLSSPSLLPPSSLEEKEETEKEVVDQSIPSSEISEEVSVPPKVVSKEEEEEEEIQPVVLKKKKQQQQKKQEEDGLLV